MSVPTLFIRLPSVAISAAYFALSYFGYYFIKRNVLADCITDGEILIPLMIKLKHNRVWLTAIYAWVSFKVLI